MKKLIAFDLQEPYYKEIDKIRKNPEEFAINVIHLASVISDHMDGHPSLRAQVINSLSSSMLENFIRIPQKHLGPMEVIKMLEDVFGDSGPFSGQPVKFSIVNEHQTAWIAALYYLQAIGDKSVTDIGKSNLKHVIAWVAFEGGKNWNELQEALREVDAGCGTSLLETVPELLQNAHLLFAESEDASRIQERGGVERVKAVGANLDMLTRSVMSDLPKTSLNEKGFPLMYTFIKEATLDLMAAGVISREEGLGRFTCLFDATLHALTRQKNHRQDCWIPILKDLSSHAGTEVDQLGLVNLCLYLEKKGAELEGFNLRSMLKPDEFKKALNKAVDQGYQYSFVTRMGLTDLFTSIEMLRLNGSRFSSELGI